MKVVVIGAGASGLTAAIYAAKNGNDVTLLERNSKCGKKILITGNGKCNYWNQNINPNSYNSENKEFLNQIITEENKQEILNLFTKIGIVPKIKDEYYYPNSNTAQSIKEALILEAKLNNVKIETDILVTEIIKKDKFIINPNKENIIADKIILSTGSKAAPKTGSDGLGYKIAQTLGHTIIKPLPALTQIITKEKPFKECNIRCDAKLSLYENQNLIKEEYGEIQLTQTGISGICTFNLSSLVSKGIDQNKKEIIHINFIPTLNCNSIDKVIEYINSRIEIVTGRTIEQFLEGMLDYKLIKVILNEANINPLKYPSELTKKEKYALAEKLYQFPLAPIDTNNFENAQVCTGGIPLTEINPKTMESLKTKDLYIIGELLDADGPCGGYNLAFAWITGMLSGKAVK